MNPQLESIRDGLIETSGQLAGMVVGTDPEIWTARPSPGAWSASECLAHLNLTSAAYVPILEEAIDRAERITGETHRYRRSFIGWLLWLANGPRPAFRVKTTASFVPEGQESRDALVTRFDELQDRQIEIVKRCDGLRIDRAMIRSPFDARIQYDVYSALTILPRHQMRHLLQAERSLEALEKREAAIGSPPHV